MTDLSSPRTTIAVVCNFPQSIAPAKECANALAVGLLLDIQPANLQEPEFVLLFDEAGVCLQQTGRKAPGPVRVDFASGAVDHRRKFGGGKGQMIAKAVGLKSGVYPSVLDVTAGLGRDAFVLATLGCRVAMLERSPLVIAMLADGLQRAALEGDHDVQAIVSRMSLQSEDSRHYLQTLSESQLPDVIYMDPMFPERTKSANVKKEMRAFHAVVGKDLDDSELLAAALQKARYRVVVKRPRKAPVITANGTELPEPSYQLEGKSGRYDIYAIKKLPDKLPGG